MSQPDWELIGQLGDDSPLDYGGYWVFRDRTGVYAPEAEYLFCPDFDDDGDDKPDAYEAYRFSLELCTYTDGTLSDNKFHPEHPAWFAKSESERKERPQDTIYLSSISRWTDITGEALIAMFTSEDILERAQAYRMVGEYHGFDNLDSDPLRMSRSEAEQRYGDVKYQTY